VQELDIYIQAAGQSTAAENPSPYKGHHLADYALLVEGKPVGVIEAKKTSHDAVMQYARELKEIQGGPVPFVFYTNGYETYYWEVDFYPPVRAYGFPTKDDLQWMIERRAGRNPMSVEMINRDIAGRSLNKLGPGTVWRSELPNCIHQNHIFSVCIRNQELIRPEFLSAQIGSSRGKRYFLRSAKQTTGIVTINKTQLSTFPCLLPPVALQRRYAAVEKSYHAWCYRIKETAQRLMPCSVRSFKGRFGESCDEYYERYDKKR
jgi:hypothetical protein